MSRVLLNSYSQDHTIKWAKTSRSVDCLASSVTLRSAGAPSASRAKSPHKVTPEDRPRNIFIVRTMEGLDEGETSRTGSASDSSPQDGEEDEVSKLMKA